MEDEAVRDRMRASRLYQTTAGPLLEKIWRKIHINGWPPLMADLKMAREADPADARTTVYLAAAMADARKMPESTALLREAVALERARLQLDDQGAGATMGRDSADFGLLIRLLCMLSDRDAKAGQNETALANALAAAKLTERFAPGGNGQRMYRAMIPDPHASLTRFPSPTNGATLAADACVAAGKLLKVQHREKEAMAYFTRVASDVLYRIDANIPKISNGNDESNYSDEAEGPSVAQALLELAKVHLTLGDAAAAMKELEATTRQIQMTDEQAKELTDLRQRAYNRLNHIDEEPAPFNWGRSR
jgi:hypothetical protein